MKARAMFLVSLFVFSSCFCKASNLKTDKLFNDDENQNSPASAKLEPKTGKHYVPLIKFYTQVDEDSVNQAIDLIKAADDANVEAIIIEFNTPGGSVPDGFRLAKVIENNKIPVQCIVDGEAASMGFYLLQSCQYRAMTKRSILMAHEPSLGGIVSGQPTRWENIYNMMKALANAMAEHCSARLTVSAEEYKSRTVGGREWWLNWEEAKTVNAVDGVITSTKSFIDDYRNSGKIPQYRY